MHANTDTITNDIETAERHRVRWTVMALVAAAVAVTAIFTLTRADASEGPDLQRVVVVSEGDPLQLLGGLSYAGYVGFEASGGEYGTVDRVMKVSEEPEVLASEINRTMGPVIQAWVEDVD